MTWSIQISLWGLPPLLALLLALHDGWFLWPRRREPGSPALLLVAGGVGAWAVLDLVGVSSTALPVMAAAAKAEYAPAALAAVAWACFALVRGGRKNELWSWPMKLLYGVAGLSAGIALAWNGPAAVMHDARLVDLGGISGLEVRVGPLRWLALLARYAAVVGGTLLLVERLARTPGERTGAVWAGAAALAALMPGVVHLAAMPQAEWADLSSSGFALGCAILVRGLMWARLLQLGPVDRDLVLNEIEDPLVVLDGRGRLVDLNRAAREELGLRPYGDVPVVLGTLWAACDAALTSPAPCVELEAADRTQRTYEVRLTRLGDAGPGSRAAFVLRDVTARERMQRELKQALAEVERLARTDPLTGLANRRSFLEALEREVERAERYGHPVSLAALDLDRFKVVNDTYGHAAGDEVLRETAHALRSVCRDVDLAARMGGEEFWLLLPETDAPGASTVAERVRARIAGTPHRAPSGETFWVTASLGVATLRPGGSTDALLREADVALYRAKDAGRNRVMAAAP